MVTKKKEPFQKLILLLLIIYSADPFQKQPSFETRPPSFQQTTELEPPATHLPVPTLVAFTKAGGRAPFGKEGGWSGEPSGEDGVLRAVAMARVGSHGCADPCESSWSCTTAGSVSRQPHSHRGVGTLT